MSAKKACVPWSLTYGEWDDCIALVLLAESIISIGSMIDTEKKNVIWGIILNVILSIVVKTKTYPILIKPVLKNDFNLF